MLALALLSYYLDHEPLAAFAAELNRHSAQQIIIADAVAGEKQISGYYRGGDTEGVVKAIAYLYPDLEVRQVEGGWVIRSADQLSEVKP